jgi:hypothetical protein
MLTLARGAACPVYATEQTWSLIDRFPLVDRHRVEPGYPFRIGTIGFEAFSVEHSLRTPAVVYRVTAGRTAFLCVPDLAAFRERAEALRGIALYIGDGATVTRFIVRQRNHESIGHAPVFRQLAWCSEVRCEARHLHPLRQ